MGGSSYNFTLSTNQNIVVLKTRGPVHLQKYCTKICSENHTEDGTEHLLQNSLSFRLVQFFAIESGPRLI